MPTEPAQTSIDDPVLTITKRSDSERAYWVGARRITGRFPPHHGGRAACRSTRGACTLCGAVALTIHERMKRVRQRDTAPEVEVRRFLHARGFRYRVCPARVPGRPDLLNKSSRWALFVHGCFWHGHRHCSLARLPKTNRSFWREKIAANRARDRRKERELVRLGYDVHKIWQCEIADATCLDRLAGRLGHSSGKKAR